MVRPLDCMLFSISRSLRRKKVVGPDGPGFEVGGGLRADLFDFSVRVSCGVYIMIAGDLSEQDMDCPKRATGWVHQARHIGCGRVFVRGSTRPVAKCVVVSGVYRSRYAEVQRVWAIVWWMPWWKMGWRRRWAVDGAPPSVHTGECGVALPLSVTPASLKHADSES
jgi:hypothetical protein